MRVVSHDCAIFLGIPLILETPHPTILIHSAALASSPTFKLPVTLNITRGLLRELGGRPFICAREKPV